MIPAAATQLVRLSFLSIVSGDRSPSVRHHGLRRCPLALRLRTFLSQKSARSVCSGPPFDGLEEMCVICGKTFVCLGRQRIWPSGQQRKAARLGPAFPGYVWVAVRPSIVGIFERPSGSCLHCAPQAARGFFASRRGKGFFHLFVPADRNSPMR